MAENSHIEWTDHTFNPWVGCTKVSPGCAHCYAEHLMDTRLGRVEWGKGKPRSRTSEANWNQVRRWNKAEHSKMVSHAEFVEARRPRVFCASLADWLDDEVPIEWLVDLLQLIRATPNLDWLLLTKRPENFRARVGSFADKVVNAPMELQAWVYDWFHGKPPQNIWIGTSVEDQARADERIPQLLGIPARVRFLSMEPLLGPVDLQQDYWLTGQARRKDKSLQPVGSSARASWVIVGGESGNDARPMHPDWVTSLRDQCVSGGTAFFFKQWGGVNKKVAGRELDGREWSELPVAR